MKALTDRFPTLHVSQRASLQHLEWTLVDHNRINVFLLDPQLVTADDEVKKDAILSNFAKFNQYFVDKKKVGLLRDKESLL